MLTMKTSAKGRAFIESNEGCVLVARYDAKGHWEIGYGHDILPGENFGSGITRQRADEIFADDLAHFEPYVNAAVPQDCTQNQFDALMDFVYEEGVGGFHMLMSHGWEQVSAQMLRWDYVDGAPNASVEARRRKDVVLFNS